MASANAVRLSPRVEKQKLKLELLRESRPKLESLPVSVVVHQHLVRAGCMFFGTATRRTLTRLHRRLVAKSNRYARTQKSSNSFIRFRCSNSSFVLENWYCWSRKGFPRQMTPQSREKNCEDGHFSRSLAGMKSCTVDRAVRQHPRTPRNWRCSLTLFSSLFFDISMKNSVQR